MSIPLFPQLPDDDPIGAVRLLRNYVFELSNHISTMILFGGIGLCLAALFAFAWWFVGLDSTLSWASDFVPLAFSIIGIGLTVKKVVDEHQSALLALLIIVGIAGSVILHLSRTREQAKMNAVATGNTQILDMLRNPPSTPLTPQEAQIQRMQNIQKALRGEYILSHSDISAGLLAGTENPPADWTNKRLHEMGENWTFKESEPLPRVSTRTNPTAVSPERPDVALRFVGVREPTVVIENHSSVVARDIKWAVGLWNMDRPTEMNPLQIPAQIFDFIKPHDESGLEDLFSRISSSLKDGDRLFGSVSVDCPECGRGRTYVVYIVWRSGGWFSELKEGVSSGKLIIPVTPVGNGLFSYFVSLENMVPVTSRIPIKDQEHVAVK